MPVEFIADLHIHTCLSPCADLRMTPRRIMEEAASKGINILAVCDHNSAENVDVAMSLGRQKGIRVFAGIEITSEEEVHLLGLFGSVQRAIEMQEIVYQHLQPGENDEEAFGMQVVVNDTDDVLSFNRRLLIGATALTVERLVEIIHGLEGIAVASHIDREGFGIIGQIGFIPEGAAFDALEISRRTTLSDARQRFGMYGNTPWISSSDAHRPGEIGSGISRLFMCHSTFDEFRLALRGCDGRSVRMAED